MNRLVQQLLIATAAMLLASCSRKEQPVDWYKANAQQAYARVEWCMRQRQQDIPAADHADTAAGRDCHNALVAVQSLGR